jgi:hypothetical protein
MASIITDSPASLYDIIPESWEWSKGHFKISGDNKSFTLEYYGRWKGSCAGDFNTWNELIKGLYVAIGRSDGLIADILGELIDLLEGNG